jgi:hypothetical protein
MKRFNASRRELSCRAQVSNRHEITWSGSAAKSASFNSEAVAVGIRGTVGAVGTTGAVGILDRVRRERRAVAAVGVTGRIRIIGVRAQLAAIVSLLVIEPRCIGGEGIRRRLIAEGTAVGAEGIVDAVRLEGASGSEGIGRGIRIVRIRAQLAEIFGVDREREWQQHQKEEENPHGEPSTSGTVSGLSLLPC